MKYSKMILGALSALFMSVSVAHAVGAPNWNSWLNNYYQSPQPDQIVPAMHALSRSGYFESAGQPATTIGFLSTIFAQNPDKVDGWMNACRDLPVAHQRIMASARFYSGLPGGDRNLRELAAAVSPATQAEIDALIARGVRPVRDTAVLSESSLNLQWGAFLASGDQRYIENALAALGSDRAELSVAARLSLADKAAAHPRVMEICQAELSRQPASVQNQMRAAMASVSARP